MSRSSSGRYILDGHRPVPCGDLLTWAWWLESADRHVAKTQIGPLWVSTVFLGLDHNHGGHGAPQLFETIVFDGVEDSYQERYATWDEAEKGHAAAVESAQQQLAKAELLLKTVRIKPLVGAKRHAALMGRVEGQLGGALARQRLTYRERDLAAALKILRRDGVKIGRVRIDKDGVSIEPARDGELVAQESDRGESDAERAARIIRDTPAKDL